MAEDSWIVTWMNFGALSSNWPLHEQEWFSSEKKARAFIAKCQIDYPTEDYQLAHVIEVFPAKQKRGSEKGVK